MIRLAAPDIDAGDLDAVAAALRSGFLVQGERVRAFEEEVARYVGSTHAVAVSNGTAALHLALLALGVGPGDRVAVATYSWPATVNVILLAGAEPVFVEIEPRGFTMDPAALAAVLERSSGVRAVLPVHAFGGVADMARITEVAARHGVPVVEDAACALGACHGRRRAGTWGRIGCFSFHPRKAITTGEGGMLVTDDDAIARQARALRNHGQDPLAAPGDFIAPGYNYRLTELQAALGASQMARVDAMIARRRELAARYDALLADVPVTVPAALPGATHVYQTYAVLLPPGAAPHRAALIDAMRGRGVEVAIGTHHMPLIRHVRERFGFRAGDFPVTDDVAARALALPLHAGLTVADQERVAAVLAGALRTAAAA